MAARPKVNDQVARPRPPESMLDDGSPEIVTPAPELSAWAKALFIEELAPLVNEDHEHLRYARIECLWTNLWQTRQMNRVVAMAEMPRAQGNVWVRQRHDQQLITWFGQVPHFLLTFDAHYAAACSDIRFCATMEHELYHCGQKLDPFGSPAFSKMTGLPLFAIKGHDVEEHVGIVRRYGAGNGAGKTAQLVRVASLAPEVGEADIAGICGTCGR